MTNTTQASPEEHELWQLAQKAVPDDGWVDHVTEVSNALTRTMELYSQFDSVFLKNKSEMVVDNSSVAAHQRKIETELVDDIIVLSRLKKLEDTLVKRQSVAITQISYRKALMQNLGDIT